MRDRSRLISVEVSEQAKKIYDTKQHKGEFVSDAIIEKAAKEASQEPFTEEQIKYLMQMEDRILQRVLKELEVKK
jgi:hypothetical protein